MLLLRYDKVVNRYGRWIQEKGILAIGFQVSNGLLMIYFMIVVLFIRYQLYNGGKE